VLSWIGVLAPIFGPAMLVFAVWFAANHGLDTKRRPYTSDVRPYDPRRLRR